MEAMENSSTCENGKMPSKLFLQMVIMKMGTVQKEISQELTYKDMYASADNIWSALFMTGYLTQRGEPEGKRYNLVVPNLEIRNIIVSHVLLLFQRKGSRLITGSLS